MTALTWQEQSDAHAQPLIGAWSSFDPEAFTAYGYRKVDRETSTPSPDLAARRMAAFSSCCNVAAKELTRATDPEVRFDLEILIERTQQLVVGAEIDRDVLMPYDDVVEILYYGLSGLRTGSLSEADALERLRRYAGRSGVNPLSTLPALSLRSCR